MIPRIWKFHRSILIMLTVILSVLVIAIPQAVRATPSLGLDGIGKPSGCCGSQLLTTGNAGDVVVLVAECGFRLCNGNVSSVTDSSGLSYALRSEERRVGKEGRSG